MPNSRPKIKLADLDPITTEVIGSSLLAAAEEMGEVLVRASYSTNIKERRDCSTGILDVTGSTIAQASHIPLHMGSMLGLAQAILERYPQTEIQQGDVFITNDPYSGGGSHLPDITVAAPYFSDDELLGFVANVAHHAEVGGSPSQTIDIYSEGVRIPLVRLRRTGTLSQDILDFILINCRLPDERLADLQAQLASLEIGLRRMDELIKKYQVSAFKNCLAKLEAQAEQQARQAFRSIPSGIYEFTDYMDNDGIGSELLAISVELHVNDGHILCDFSGSSPQVKGPINNPYFATLASIYYTLKAALDPSLPANSGFYKAISVEAPAASIVNCSPPAPCLFRSDVAQRVVDVVLGALSKAIPERVVAAGNGATTGVYFLGHKHDGSYYAYIETLGGGMGASLYGDGADGVQVHTTNTSNLPVEALELEYPLLVERYELVEDSGGPGENRGGLGILRQYRILSDETKIRTKGDRSVLSPWGLKGGLAGGKSRAIRNVSTKNQENLNIKEYSLILDTDETLSIITPGAGGYGDPKKRDKSKVRLDAKEGKISKQSALRDYGIKL